MANRDVLGGRSSDRNYRGASLQVDMSPGLWEGRQFRAYRRVAATVQLRFQAVKPFILTNQFLTANVGQLAATVVVQPSTDTGVWAPILAANGAQVAKNRLPANTYVRQNTLQSGGAFTGGTEVEYLIANAGNGQGNTAQNVLGQPRLLPAGLYYFSIVASGTTPAGVYGLEWEELD